MLQDVTTDLCSQNDIVYKLFEDFLKERIQNKNKYLVSNDEKKVINLENYRKVGNCQGRSESSGVKRGQVPDIT